MCIKLVQTTEVYYNNVKKKIHFLEHFFNQNKKQRGVFWYNKAYIPSHYIECFRLRKREKVKRRRLTPCEVLGVGFFLLLLPKQLSLTHCHDAVLLLTHPKLHRFARSQFTERNKTNQNLFKTKWKILGVEPLYDIRSFPPNPSIRFSWKTQILSLFF